MSREHPLLVAAAVIWVISALMVVVSIAFWRRQKVLHEGGTQPGRVSRLAIYLLSLGLFGAALGVAVYFAGPGELGTSSPVFEEPLFVISPDASPLVMPSQPTLTDSSEARGMTPTTTPAFASAKRLSEQFKVVFEPTGQARIYAWSRNLKSSKAHFLASRPR